MNIHSPSQQVKTVVLGHNLTAAGATTYNVDCRGYSRCQIQFIATTAAGGTIAVSPLEECATSGGPYAAVGSTQFAAVIASQTDQLQLMDIDLNKRLEFLEIVVGAVVGTVSVTIVANLFNAEGANTSLNTPVVPIVV